MKSSLKNLLSKLIPKTWYNQLLIAYHFLEAVFYTVRYGFPARRLKIIGVTGTNGKTSTCFMIHEMLTDAGLKTALMTTVAHGVGREIIPQTEHVTTISSGALQRQLRDYKRQGVEWVVLETTSHALAQHRVLGVTYRIGVLTNITHEHLDYHRTFEKYARAKAKLLKKVDRRGGISIVNADDPASMQYSEKLRQRWTYGLKQGNFLAEDVKLGATDSHFKVEVGRQTYKIHCHIPGEFNVYNALATVLVGRAVGLSSEQIEAGLAAVKTIEGRMQLVKVGQAYSALIDFAHNPDSFEKLFSAMRPQVKGKLVVLFGSPGQRDEAKRAIQGEIAGRYADELVLTEEDNRDADGQQILQQIAGGASKSGKELDKNIFLIADRKQAIEFAVTRVSQPDDMVMFLGKGHEKTIEQADKTIDWNERAEVERAIKAQIKA